MSIKSLFKRLLPIYKGYALLQDELRKWKKGLWPPGHYYSPIVNEKDIPKAVSIDYEAFIQGVDLNEEFQLGLLDKLKTLYENGLFPDSKEDASRYYFDNDYFGYSDGITLHLLMRYFEPKKIVEVGSGFSSALMLDTNDRFFDGKIQLKFIEPYPEERLLSLTGKNDQYFIVKDFVQNVANDVWDALGENDILFIDSSHVSKYRSDVNFLFFNVFPRLKKGVIVHIHDVFFPFEYPLLWLQQGRFWNEAYLLHAFLQYNNAFEIILFSSFLEGKHREWYEVNMPLCLKEHKTIVLNGVAHPIRTTGQSIYLRRK